MHLECTVIRLRHHIGSLKHCKLEKVQNLHQKTITRIKTATTPSALKQTASQSSKLFNCNLLGCSVTNIGHHPRLFHYRSPGAPAGFQARVGKIRRKAPKKFFSFAHPGFQFAHPAIRNGCPPCPPYRGGFKGKGLVGH